ncbi:Shr3 amino acid permease chaperone [Phlebopus sp. FC_14]|nr:Shr3 amino acid permease chaperone [Phlebopus sp. FC_14]
MGVRASVVVCVTSFLLGSLFTHWIADSLTLWKSPVTDEHLWTAALYYSILTKGPVQILYVLSAIIVLGGTTIFWSLHDGEAGNLMFDGGSIFLYGTTVIMYIYSVIPSLLDKFSYIPHDQVKGVFPRSLRSPTLELASNHLVCSVALTGVLILQAGRWWAELSDGDDEGYLEEKAAEDSEAGEDLRSSKIPIATS